MKIKIRFSFRSFNLFLIGILTLFTQITFSQSASKCEAEYKKCEASVSASKDKKSQLADCRIKQASCESSVTKKTNEIEDAKDIQSVEIADLEYKKCMDKANAFKSDADIRAAKVQVCENITAEKQKSCETTNTAFITAQTTLEKDCAQAGMGEIRTCMSSANQCIETSGELDESEDDYLDGQGDDKLSSLTAAAGADNQITSLIRELEKETRSERSKVISKCPEQSYKDYKEESDKLEKALKEAQEAITDMQSDYSEDSQEMKTTIAKAEKDLTEIQKDFDQERKDLTQQQREHLNESKKQMKEIQDAISKKQQEISQATAALSVIPEERASMMIGLNRMCRDEISKIISERAKTAHLGAKGLSGAAGGQSYYSRMYAECLQRLRIQKSASIKQMNQKESQLNSSIDSANAEITSLNNQYKDSITQNQQIAQEISQGQNSALQNAMANMQAKQKEISSLRQQQQETESIFKQKMALAQKNLSAQENKLRNLPKVKRGVKGDSSTALASIGAFKQAANNLINDANKCCVGSNKQGSCDDASKVVNNEFLPTETKDSPKKKTTGAR